MNIEAQKMPPSGEDGKTEIHRLELISHLYESSFSAGLQSPDYRILQIIPAPDSLFAKFGKDDKFALSRIAALALVKLGQFTDPIVCGIEANADIEGLALCEELTDFLGYQWGGAA